MKVSKQAKKEASELQLQGTHAPFLTFGGKIIHQRWFSALKTQVPQQAKESFGGHHTIEAENITYKKIAGFYLMMQYITSFKLPGIY